MSPSKSLQSVAIFGAGGTNIGHHTLHALLTHPAFKVSVIARESSKSSFPATANVIRIPDKASHADLVAAFRGQDAIVSAVGFPAKLAEYQLIDAAIEAGVKRFLPSEYGLDNSYPPARALSPVFDAKGAVQEYLKSKEPTGLTWTSVATGVWLEWALDPAHPFLLIDPRAHTAALLDHGTYRLSLTTLHYSAHAILQILLHPHLTANKLVRVRAFEASQLDILHALETVQNATYTTTHLDSTDLVADARPQIERTKGLDLAAALPTVQVGFLCRGYGSNFVEDDGKTQILDGGSGGGHDGDMLALPELTLEGVVRQAVDMYGV